MPADAAVLRQKKIDANHKSVKALRSYQENMHKCTLTHDAINEFESYATQLTQRCIRVPNDEIPVPVVATSYKQTASKLARKTRPYKSKSKMSNMHKLRWHFRL